MTTESSERYRPDRGVGWIVALLVLLALTVVLGLTILAVVGL